MELDERQLREMDDLDFLDLITLYRQRKCILSPEQRFNFLKENNLKIDIPDVTITRGQDRHFIRAVKRAGYMRNVISFEQRKQIILNIRKSAPKF